MSFGTPTAHPELGTNSQGSMEPAPTADGRTIYFAPTDSCISVATRPAAPGVFTKVGSLGCPHHIEAPALGNDPSLLYFTDHDLVSSRERIGRSPLVNNSTAMPELVEPFQVDPTADYFEPYVTADKLLFARRDSSGTHRAYVARVPCP